MSIYEFGGNVIQPLAVGNIVKAFGQIPTSIKKSKYLNHSNCINEYKHCAKKNIRSPKSNLSLKNGNSFPDQNPSEEGSSDFLIPVFLCYFLFYTSKSNTFFTVFKMSFTL